MRKPSPISTSSPRDDHDRAARRERAGDQGERGGAVVDDVHASGVGHGGGERRHRGAAAPAAAAGRRGRAPRRSRPPPRRAPRRPPTTAGRGRGWCARRTPVALTTRRRAVATGGRSASAADATSSGSTSPARHRSSARVDGLLDERTAEPLGGLDAAAGRPARGRCGAWPAASPARPTSPDAWPRTHSRRGGGGRESNPPGPGYPATTVLRTAPVTRRGTPPRTNCIGHSRRK